MYIYRGATVINSMALMLFQTGSSDFFFLNYYEIVIIVDVGASYAVEACHDKYGTQWLIM